MSDDSIMHNDIDLVETQEWVEALDDVVAREGKERAAYLVNQLHNKVMSFGLKTAYAKANINYQNTISVEHEPIYPGNIEIENKIEAIHRWNAAVIVAKANKKDGSLGGHIGSGASILTLYEVGFNHCFKASTEQCPGDLIFFQGHTTPVIYARSYVEGRLTDEQLCNFRSQAFNKDKGLSSYPHPWLQPNYWQFPTVSMGLGPMQAIYQARFMKYLENRGLVSTTNRHVWAFCGDGEMDEPESMGALTRAAREGLNNLTFVINCNLQRLDGPVYGNGKIVEEFASVFNGAGWDVIKVLWDGNWQELFEKDTDGLIIKRLAELNDGQMQNIRSHGGKAMRELIFGHDEKLLKLVEHISDDDLMKMNRGGHDQTKVYAAYKRAMESKDRPTVILAQTIKGYGLGEHGESQNIAHNVKKLKSEALAYLKKRFDIPVDDSKVENMEFISIDKNSDEYNYLQAQRKNLGGYIPQRREANEVLDIPHYTDFGKLLLKSSGDRELSSTTCFVRLLVALTRHKPLKDRLVPITVDESRTFGMEGLFRQLGIYNHEGQLYVPEDRDQVMYYKEAIDGQIIQDGINEAGGFSSWLAAATSYSVHNISMIPFYIYYSMFGFQRIGDLAWAAADSHARGFLLGGTAGRTSLNGEGLQHQDGHSHIQAGLIPNCISYDPTYGYELAVILWDGMRRMYVDHESIFYYITLMNENYAQPEMPEGVEEGILKGIYKLKSTKSINEKKHVRLLGSGTILREVEEASEILDSEYNISSEVYSVTSANELTREAQATKRWNMLHPGEEKRVSYIEKVLGESDAPVVISTDYIKLYSDQLREFIPSRYNVLGTDGFGRSDSRENLRRYFEVDKFYVVISALSALADDGVISHKEVKDAIKKYNIDADCINPTLS